MINKLKKIEENKKYLLKAAEILIATNSPRNEKKELTKKSKSKKALKKFKFRTKRDK